MELKEGSKNSSQESQYSKAKAKDLKAPYVISIKLMEVKVGDNKFIAVAVSDLSVLPSLSFKITQTKYQKMLTNALSHERMTPLNAITNSCEKLYRKLN